ncbi:HTTM domain-containing protein [Aeromicrobium piscarium]|uniref:HTTM domain-containing protein n=1 Tax=Aeromicrobium piscarium TaxID=2590901 RepID=A0A554S770_9ACTN|nr:HTTM domain-containing protein [Aeromicrobium piscarium]TSD62189.1 HTTM domain-containing protein [Aeromicrobium piscarium]
MRTLIVTALDRLADLLGRGEDWVLEKKHALYGLAVSRILVGIAALGVLLANFGHRHALWGGASEWVEPLRRDSSWGFLYWVFDGGPTRFTLTYLLLMAVAIAVIVGWRTRAAVAVLVIGLAALVERNGLVGDQGDNIARVGLLLMLFMDTSRHWSLDARRRSRVSDADPLWRRWWGGGSVLPEWLSTVLHNVALIALALQLFILYTASALFKMQGTYWQDGTAIYYPLALHEFGVFPWLNTLLTGNGLGVMIGTYVGVLVQLYFVIGLLHPVTRRIVLIGVVLLHGGIAVLMGLPWFSLSMLAFDAIFVSTATFMALDRWLKPRVTAGTAALRAKLPARVGGTKEDASAQVAE